MIPRRFITLRESDPKKPTAGDQDQETGETRIALSVKRATWIIALATAVNVALVGLQWRVMEGQLTEMKGTGIQTDKIIDANQKLADAAVKQAEAAVTSGTTFSSQLAVMQKQLEEMHAQTMTTRAQIRAGVRRARAANRSLRLLLVSWGLPG
jgi:hypothetical protein